MQIDAVTAPRPPPSAWSSMPDVWAKIKSICWTKRFCFCCLQGLNSSHGDPGRFRCPNSVAMADQGLAFLTEHKPVKTNNSNNSSMQVDALEIDGWSGGVTNNQESRLRSMTSEYLAHEHSLRNYDELEVSSLTIPPISKDRSCFFVFISLLNRGEPVLIKALVDTGLMGCFLHSRIVNEKRLQTSSLSSPISCSGFDGTPGKEIVKRKWTGLGCFCIGDSVSNEFPFDLLVNDIGPYDMILGMPWLEANEARILCKPGATSMEISALQLTVSSLNEEQSHMKPIDMIPLKHSDQRHHNSLPIIPLINEKELLPFSPDPSLISQIPAAFHSYLDVFQPSSISLPPHRKFDVAIELKEGKEPPCNRAYEFSDADEKELRLWIEDQLSKGFIRPSSSPAAAPAFLVKSPGQKNRPCIDYRGLNKVTVRDSYPIPLVKYLLHQLQGCNFF